MKYKLLLGLLLGFLCSSGYLSAQTYEYKYLYSVRANGEKYKHLITLIKYMTFSKDGATCHNSVDEDGTPGLFEAAYLERSNEGYLVYRVRVDEPISGNIVDGYVTRKKWLDYYFYFSSDFLRMNFRDEVNGVTDVYERHILEHPKQLY